MLINKFKHISFGGQLSDPIHYPKFIEVLKLCNEKNKSVRVQTASSFKPISWYKKRLNIYPQADWQFGLDGLPKESHKYRVNQDGKKIFQVMLRQKTYLQKHLFGNTLYLNITKFIKDKEKWLKKMVYVLLL